VTGLFAQAQRVREAKSQVQKARNELDSTWMGGAKKKSYISQLDSLINEYGRYANSLETKAGEIAGITVWIEIKEWFEDLIPGK
jgi:flagellar biosynthesis chaperone FliJ